MSDRLGREEATSESGKAWVGFRPNAHRVFDNPEKITIPSHRGGEARQLDVALVEESGLILAFVHVHRGDVVRAIPFRIASRRERRPYAKNYEELD